MKKKKPVRSAGFLSKNPTSVFLRMNDIYKELSFWYIYIKKNITSFSEEKFELCSRRVGTDLTRQNRSMLPG